MISMIMIIMIIIMLQAYIVKLGLTCTFKVLHEITNSLGHFMK